MTPIPRLGEMLYNETEKASSSIEPNICKNVSISTGVNERQYLRVSSPDIPFIGDVLADFAL